MLSQVYFTTYEKLKAHMRKREGMPQPIQHMVSAVGAGTISSNLLLPRFASQAQNVSALTAQRPETPAKNCHSYCDAS